MSQLNPLKIIFFVKHVLSVLTFTAIMRYTFCKSVKKRCVEKIKNFV
jgi:hypothetical protein